MVTSEHLTVVLAEVVMGWTVCPDRFLMPHRRWIPRWRFQPEQNLNDAFRRLHKANPDAYAVGSRNPGAFWTPVGKNGRIGEANDPSLPRAIAVAVARVLGIDPGGV